MELPWHEIKIKMKPPPLPISNSPVESGGNLKIKEENISDSSELESNELNDFCQESPSKINQFFDCHGSFLYEDVLEDANSLENYLSSVPEVKCDVTEMTSDVSQPPEDDKSNSIEVHNIYSSHKSYFSEKKLNVLNNTIRKVVPRNSIMDCENPCQTEYSDLSIGNLDSRPSRFDNSQMQPYGKSASDIAASSGNKPINIELSVASSVPVDANKCVKKKGRKSSSGKIVLPSPIIHRTPRNCKSDYSRHKYNSIEDKKQLRVSLTDILANNGDYKNHLKDKADAVYLNKFISSPDANWYKSIKNKDSEIKAKNQNINKTASRKSPRKKSFIVKNGSNQILEEDQIGHLNSPKNSELENLKKCKRKRMPKQPIIEPIPGPSKSVKINIGRKSSPKKAVPEMSEKKLALDEAIYVSEDEDGLLEEKLSPVGKCHVQNGRSKLTSPSSINGKESSVSDSKIKDKNNCLNDILSKSSKASESCPTPRSSFMQLFSKVAPKNSSEAPFQSDFITKFLQQANYKLKTPKKQTTEAISPALSKIESLNNTKKKSQQSKLLNSNSVDQLNKETLDQRDMSADKSAIKKEPQSDSSIIDSQDKSRKRKRSKKGTDNGKSRINSNFFGTKNDFNFEINSDSDLCDEVQDNDSPLKSNKHAKKTVKKNKIKVSGSSISLFENNNSCSTKKECSSKQNNSVKKRKRCGSVSSLEIDENESIFFKEEQSDEISSVGNLHSSANATPELKKQSFSGELNSSNNILEIKTEFKEPSKQVENTELFSRNIERKGKNKKAVDESSDETFTDVSLIRSNNELQANSFEQENTPVPFNNFSMQDESGLPDNRLIYRLKPGCQVHYDPHTCSNFLSYPLNVSSLQQGLIRFESPISHCELPFRNQTQTLGCLPFPRYPQFMPSVIAPQIVQPVGIPQAPQIVQPVGIPQAPHIVQPLGIPQAIADMEHSSPSTSVFVPVTSSDNLANNDFTSVSPAQICSDHHKLNESTKCASSSMAKTVAVFKQASQFECGYVLGEGETSASVGKKLQNLKRSYLDFNWEFIMRRSKVVNVPRVLEQCENFFVEDFVTCTVKKFCSNSAVVAGLYAAQEQYADDLHFPAEIEYPFYSSLFDDVFMQALKDCVFFYLRSVFRKIEGKRGMKLKSIFLGEVYAKFPISFCTLFGVMLPQSMRSLTLNDITSILTMICMVLIFREWMQHANKVNSEMPSILS